MVVKNEPISDVPAASNDMANCSIKYGIAVSKALVPSMASKRAASSLKKL